MNYKIVNIVYAKMVIITMFCIYHIKFPISLNKCGMLKVKKAESDIIIRYKNE